MKVLCYGDSNTYGYDPRGIFADRYDVCWCDLLAQKTGWEVFNCGVNGQTLVGSVRWIDCYLNKYGAVDRLLIMMGSNDMLQRRSTDRIIQDMDLLLEHLQVTWPDVEVFLLSPPPIAIWEESFDAPLTEVAQGYRRLAEKRKLPFADPAAWNLPMAFDGIHLSEDGHRAFAVKLLQELEKT